MNIRRLGLAALALTLALLPAACRKKSDKQIIAAPAATAQSTASSSTATPASTAPSSATNPFNPFVITPTAPIPGLAGRAYVTNSVEGRITPVDLGTQTALTPLSVGGVPAGVFFDRQGLRGYVPNLVRPDLAVIDGTNGQLGTPVSLMGPAGGLFGLFTAGLGAVGADFSPSGHRAYVVTAFNAKVLEIDTATGARLRDLDLFPSGILPDRIAVDPTGTRAVVTSLVSANVIIIDIATLSIAGMINVGEGPTGIAIDSAGKFAYVTCALTAELYVIDLPLALTNKIIPTGGLAPVDVVLSRDEKTAFVVHFISGDVGAIDLVNGRLDASILVGSGMPQVLQQAGLGTFTGTQLSGFFQTFLTQMSAGSGGLQGFLQLIGQPATQPIGPTQPAGSTNFVQNLLSRFVVWLGGGQTSAVQPFLTGLLQGSLTTGIGLKGIARGRRSDAALVTNWLTGQVSSIDTLTRQVRHLSVRIGPGATGVAVVD